MASKKFGVSDIEVTGNLSVSGVGTLGITTFYTDIDKNISDPTDDSSALKLYNPGDGPCLTVDSGDSSKPVFQISHTGVGTGSGYFNLSSFDSYRPTQTGTAITNKAVDSSALFGTDDEVYQYYRDNIGFFDMDQDGVVSPSDAAILQRGLFGAAFDGTALTNNLVMGTGTYTNSDYAELYDRIQVMSNAPYTQNVNVGITTTILTGVTTSQVIVGNNYPVGASTFIAANTEVTAIGSGEVTISKATTNTVSLTGVAVTFGMASHGYGMLDVDGDGETTVFSDGLMIIRMVGSYSGNDGDGLNPIGGIPINTSLEPRDFGPPRYGYSSQPRIGIGTQSSNTKSLSIVGSTEIRGSVDLTGDLNVSGSVHDGSGSLRKIPQNTKTSSYILAASDAGKHISITTGGVTIPASVLSVGDVVTIYNNSGSNQAITQGTSTTLRQAGTSNTGNRTLGQYGLATLLCVASDTFVVSGAGLS